MQPKYPDITVRLTSSEGNAFSILGKMIRALKRAKVSQDEIDQFQDDAISGNYDHLLQVCMEWVEVE